MKPVLLVTVFLSQEHQRFLSERFEVIYAPNEQLGLDRKVSHEQMALHAEAIGIVLTNGSNGLHASEMQRLPNLELVCTVGVGYENVDLAYAKANQLKVANAAGTNDSCVADHAFMLLLAATRRLPFLNTGVRRGLWRDDIPRPPHVSGRRIGIVGLGAIGKQIAKRAGGFDMKIGYHSRTERPECGYQYFSSVRALAHWSDFLVVAAPGGADTQHMIDAAVLDALGAEGVLVNVARGSLVDTHALAAALRENRLYAAGLDVYEGEPKPPAELIDLENVVLTPHIGGTSPQAVHASVMCFIKNVDRHLAGEPLFTPVLDFN